MSENDGEDGTGNGEYYSNLELEKLMDVLKSSKERGFQNRNRESMLESGLFSSFTNNIYARFKAFCEEFIEYNQRAYCRDELEEEVGVFRTICTKLKEGLYGDEDSGKTQFSLRQKHAVVAQEIERKTKRYIKTQEDIEDLQHRDEKDVELKPRQIPICNQGSYVQLVEKAAELRNELTINLIPLQEKYKLCLLLGREIYQHLSENCQKVEQLLVRSAKESGRYFISTKNIEDIHYAQDILQHLHLQYSILFHGLQGRSRKPLEELLLATAENSPMEN